MNLIQKYTKTNYAKILHKKLQDIYDNDQFLIGILGILENDTQRKILIDEIDKGHKNIDYIMLLAFDIAEGLEK